MEFMRRERVYGCVFGICDMNFALKWGLGRLWYCTSLCTWGPLDDDMAPSAQQD